MIGASYDAPKIGTASWRLATLDLPVAWQSLSTEYVVSQLLRQADVKGRYPEASRAMAGASLEFMLSGPRWVERPETATLLEQPKGWRINGWFICVLPRLDDEAVESLVDLAGPSRHLDVLAPPWAKSVAQHAIKGIFPRCFADVYAIDSYIGVRLCLTTLDMQVFKSQASNHDPLLDLLHRYARLVREIPEIGIDLAQLPPGRSPRARPPS